MSRMRKFFEWRFRRLIQESGVADQENRISELFVQASNKKTEFNLACAVVYAQESAKLCREKGERVAEDPLFLCDEGLGGLARWIRAAGYRSNWVTNRSDAEVIKIATDTGAILVTTDTLMMERGVLRDRLVRAIWVPPTATPQEQLPSILIELCLSPREPRCMTCGGPLLQRPKESLKHRIPPKTYLWIDEYFLCLGCDKLFWRGTHWQKITRRIEAAYANV